MAYHASAVGGLYGNEAPSPELYLRWLQAAVFSSHLCLHGADEREPWAFGTEAEAIARKWLAFRYRLIPYLKTVVAEAPRNAMPVMRAMALAFPANPLLRSYETQFMCGNSLLVAPIVQPGGQVEIALPPGAWYDLNSRQRLPGGRILRYRATLDQFPAFGREGHALPLGPAVQHTGEIDAARPLEQLWLFGKPAQALAGFAQAWIVADAHGGFSVGADARLRVERFGDATELSIARRE
jgi:alpha-D-xyloside xylohydrolase